MAEERQKELIVKLGNESNPPDGLWGPFTYGLGGAYEFNNGLGIEAVYVRMHEPHTSWSQSVLDEGQFSIRAPELKACVLGLTAWKNRVVDMYTNLFGIEVSNAGDLNFLAGIYAGTAEREEERKRFTGVQAGMTYSFTEGREVSLACLVGKIEDGNYRKCGIEGGFDFRSKSTFPITLTASVEERVFDFGKNGSKSSPPDEFIFISGLEMHFENLF